MDARRLTDGYALGGKVRGLLRLLRELGGNQLPPQCPEMVAIEGCGAGTPSPSRSASEFPRKVGAHEQEFPQSRRLAALRR